MLSRHAMPPLYKTNLIRNLKVFQSMFNLLLGKTVDVSERPLAVVVPAVPRSGSWRVRRENVLHRV